MQLGRFYLNAKGFLFDCPSAQGVGAFSAAGFRLLLAANFASEKIALLTNPDRMRALTLSLSLSLLLTTQTAFAEKIYALNAPDSLRPLLELGLPSTEAIEGVPQDISARIGLVRRLRSTIPDLLATEGYFSPTIDININANPIAVTITPGPRTKVANVRIEFKGALSEANFADRAKKLREDWLLPASNTFRQEEWTKAKEKLLLAITNKNFPAAKITESLADIDPDRAQAHLKVVVDSGAAYTFGALKIEGLSDYDADLIERYNPLKEGEPYSLERLLSLQSALQNTPYFSTVEVSIDTEVGQPTQAPVIVRVAESKPKRFTFSTGYSTNLGARAEVAFRDANIFGNAWQLSSGLSAEEKRQSIFGDIYLPPELAGHRHSLGAQVEHSDINGLDTQVESIGLARTHTRGDFSTRIGVSFQHERNKIEGIDNQPNDLTTLALNWIWTQRNVDNPLNPRKGYILSTQLGGASQALLSTSTFLRTYARVQTYWPITPNDVLQTRVEGGYTMAENRTDVPEDFLFRTGGSQTVRGYKYLDLGVHEGEATLGGRYMGLGSIEYTHWLNDLWGAAAFIDAGNAVDSVQEWRAKIGYGLGVRFRSPAGPIAMDVAYGQDDKKLRLHISISVAF